MSKIYIIMPIRNATTDEIQECAEYVRKLEDEGHEVFFPQRDAQQQDETGLKMIMEELETIATADEVHIMWDATSCGSHFNLGVAMALGKNLKLIHSFYPDIETQSYEKAMKQWILTNAE